LLPGGIGLGATTSQATSAADSELHKDASDTHVSEPVAEQDPSKSNLA
jgi:hypothetical protein